MWNEGRQGNLPYVDGESYRGDVQDLLRLHPANPFLVRLSCWLNR